MRSIISAIAIALAACSAQPKPTPQDPTLAASDAQPAPQDAADAGAPRFSAEKQTELVAFAEQIVQLFVDYKAAAEAHQDDCTAMADALDAARARHQASIDRANTMPEAEAEYVGELADVKLAKITPTLAERIMPCWGSKRVMAALDVFTRQP